METIEAGKIKKSDDRHAPEMSKQTGFPSPATHYLEPAIDLNKELTTNKDATFYVRIAGDGWVDFNIRDKDVLIIDRSLTPSFNSLLLVIDEGAFKIVRSTINVTREECILWGIITYIIHRAI